MAPVKFDDISKVAGSVLGDDYQEKGYVFKTKQKTSWDGAVISSQVDLFGKDCHTPAKLTWKLPTPLGLSHFCIDKLELDKAGKMKMECSTDKVYKDLKIEMKSDLADPSKITAHCTYTGLKDLQVKFDAPLLNPVDFTKEVTYASGIITVGAKFSKGIAGITSPDLGVRMLQGPYFGSLMLKDGFKTTTAHGFYKASDKLKCAATYTHGGKASGNFSLGIFYELMKGTSLKAKVAQDQSVSCSVKHELSKGFTIIGGGKYETAKGDYTYGLQLSVE